MSTPEMITKDFAQFMKLFAQLKNCTNDDPKFLEMLAKKDASELLTEKDAKTKRLCVELESVASQLSWHMSSSPDRFTVEVNSAAIQAWRDYEERYSEILSEYFSFLSEIFPDLFPSTERLLIENKPEISHQKLKNWKNSDVDARHTALDLEFSISNALKLAEWISKQDNLFSELEYVNELWSIFRNTMLKQSDWVAEADYSNENFVQNMEDGLEAWKKLRDNCGLDARGVFRRHELIPFVLVPHRIAAQHENTKKLPMLENLRQAHEAFKFGAPRAALALLRSIVEAVLRDHYLAEGTHLDELIDNARGLPGGANKTALHYLRKLANAILHLTPKSQQNVTDKGVAQLEAMDEKQFEVGMVYLFGIVRALIEGVK